MKTLHNTDANGATKNVKDIVFWGTGESVVVQVTTQQQNIDGTYSIAEALTTVTNAIIVEHFTEGVVTSRTIEKRN